MSDLPYRPNVCIFLFNKEFNLFIGERLHYPGFWQLPQGGIEPELSVEENVLKELEEETGADKRFFKIEKQLESTYQYDFYKTPDYAVNKWRGQTQTFWVVRYNGTDEDIDIDKYSPEFRSWCWYNPTLLLKKVEPRRVKGYIRPLCEYFDFMKSAV